jgi:aryl-alcohol dehydrogenase-like predicted oxidoreductase
MRITGEGTSGPPPDPAAAMTLLRRPVELGVQLIDTADTYGPQCLPGDGHKWVLAVRDLGRRSFRISPWRH